MNKAKIPETYERLPVSSERRLPEAPFPRKYVHCAFDQLRDAVYAVLALRAAGSVPKDIHVLASWDYVEAAEWRDQQRSHLAKVFTRFFPFFDEESNEVYLHEAHRGRHILVVRVPTTEQREQVCSLLALHHAHCIKYIDTWTVTSVSLSSSM
jgi:hypothetical protein